MASTDVKVSYVADIRDLTEKLKSVTGITQSEVRAQVAAVVAGQKAQAKAINDSTKAAKDAAKQVAEVGNQSAESGSKALKAFSPIAGVLSRVSPEAGAAASSVAGLTSAFEGFAASGVISASSMAALASATAPVAVGFGILIGVMGDYTAASHSAKAAHDAFAAAMTPMSEAIASARAEQEMLNAALDSGAAKDYVAIAGLSAAADAKEAEATKALRDEKAALMQTLAESANMDNFAGQQAQNRIADIDREIGAVHAQGNELARLTVANYTIRDAIGKTGKETVKQAVATESLTDTLLKQAAAAQKDADAFAVRLATVESSAAAADDIATASGAFRLSEIERLRKAEDAAVNAYVEKARAGALTVEQVAAGEAQIRSNYQEQITGVVTTEAEKRRQAEQDASDKIAAAQQASFDAAVSNISTATGYASQALGMLEQSASDSYARTTSVAESLTDQLIAGDAYYTSAQKKELEARIAMARSSARKQFAAEKAAKLAMAVVNVAEGITQAIGSAPFPYNLPAIGIAAASGAVQVAAISAQQPTFHKGYAPDEMQARVLTKEAVLTPGGISAAGGSKAVRDLNAGVSPSTSGGTVTVYRHEVFRPFIRDFMDQPNSIRDYVNQGKIVGHRTNRRSTSG